MTQRTNATQILSVYFENKGKILTPHEYKEQRDTPIRFAAVNKIFGSWNRMENIVRTFNGRNLAREGEAPINDVDEVIANQQAARSEYEAKMRAASENVDAKTLREEAARKYVEADKLRAATVEGTIENKMRKGGITSQDAKAKKEAVEQAVAEEHALLTTTAHGAALGKQLLGGVEDNDEKTRAIAEQNAMREKTKLLAATPMGAAEAKLMEDDTDGQLTREAQARIRNELRLYVPPVKDGNVDQAVEDATSKVREETRAVVELAASDKNTTTGSAAKASEARVAEGLTASPPASEVSGEVKLTIPPADQTPDENFVSTPFDDDKNLTLETKPTGPEPAPAGESNVGVVDNNGKTAQQREQGPETPADQSPKADA